MSDEEMSRPNILLIMTDQQRGDALGCEPGQVVQTPNLDHIAMEHSRFRHAYSACPQCIPARRSLMTGLSAHGHGVYFNYNTDLKAKTLPECLSAAGYQTHLCGKLHLYPDRKLYGFMSADWADSPNEAHSGDYGEFLKSRGQLQPNAGMAHGTNENSWVARPFHLDESLHFTNWVTDSALKFLKRRDPTVPFFLKVSYHQPHHPCTPPQVYWDRYIDDPELPMPVVGEWAKSSDEPVLGTAPTSWKCRLPEKQMRQFRAGYFGCINHIDDQIGRLLMDLPQNTVVIFTSDHGDMLGDHEWNRKTRGLESSARIPLLFKFPQSMGIMRQQQREEVVELMDIMPTCLDLAGVEIPKGVEGKSLLPLLKGESMEWRPHLHGECHVLGGEKGGTQWLTDGKVKFIWDAGMGRELFFDLVQDPKECHDLSQDSQRQPEVEIWRQRLMAELVEREEGFVVDGKWNPDVITRRCIPRLERED